MTRQDVLDLIAESGGTPGYTLGAVENRDGWLHASFDRPMAASFTLMLKQPFQKTAERLPDLRAQLTEGMKYSGRQPEWMGV